MNTANRDARATIDPWQRTMIRGISAEIRPHKLKYGELAVPVKNLAAVHLILMIKITAVPSGGSMVLFDSSFSVGSSAIVRLD